MIALIAPEGCNAYDAEEHLHDVPDSVNATGYTENHWLNEYSLMCGYQELLEFDDDHRIRLWCESDHYHVLAFNNGKRIWNCYENVAAARAFFADYVKMTKEPSPSTDGLLTRALGWD